MIRLGYTHNYLANSFSIARFVTSLVKALRGKNDIIECAFVKSNAHPELRYMATPLLLGPGITIGFFNLFLIKKVWF